MTDNLSLKINELMPLSAKVCRLDKLIEYVGSSAHVVGIVSKV